jgi:hypothetical protein
MECHQATKKSDHYLKLHSEIGSEIGSLLGMCQYKIGSEITFRNKSSLERNLQIGFKDKKRNFGELGAT